MRPTFDRAAYQQRIDQSIGTANGRPLIKLVWCPEEFRWTPHRLERAPEGYTFPVFCTSKVAGSFRAPERWGLLQRLEWPQFGPTWEAIRYKRHDGSVWDLKGPCPEERYAELRLHSYHTGKCCPCIGYLCACDPDCEGNYAEPDQHLMEWIRKVAYEARQDSDVDPQADVRFFEAPNAQRELKSERETQIAESKEVTAFDKEAIDLFLRNPHSVNFTRKDSGLYLPDWGTKEKRSERRT